MSAKKGRFSVIKNGNIVLENGILWDGVVLLEDEYIVAVGRADEIAVPAGATCIDADGAYVGPGFVDIHCHGGGGYGTAADPVEAADFFLRHGTTTLLSTPSYDMNFQTFTEAIRRVKAAMPFAKTIRGFYMEGPYMNVNYGSHAYENPWRHPIDPTEYEALVDEAGDLARVWAIAPERPGLLPFLAYARRVNPHVVFAIGHSEATPAQIRALGCYRPTLQTHSMNATGRIAVPGGTRGYGPDEYCMKEPDVYAELISDSQGIHVNGEIQQLLLHNKGLHRVVLISDSTNATDPTPPHLAHITDLNFDREGGIDGSRLTMEQACRNIMTHTNCGIAQAFLMAARNPARAVGLDNEVGTIEPGKRADFVFVDDKFHVRRVVLGGEVVCSE